MLCLGRLSTSMVSHVLKSTQCAFEEENKHVQISHVLKSTQCAFEQENSTQCALKVENKHVQISHSVHLKKRTSMCKFHMC